jgi:predicted S18 family serine protease
MDREATINKAVEATAIMEVATIMADKVTTMEEATITTAETVTITITTVETVTTTITMEETIEIGEAATMGVHLFPNCWTFLRARATDFDGSQQNMLQNTIFVQYIGLILVVLF